MAIRQRHKTARHQGPGSGRKGSASKAKRVPDYNANRREKYASDPEFADKTRKQARDSYRKSHPKKRSKLARGLLTEGNEKIVVVRGEPTMMNVYTVPQSAKALGKTTVTFKRWIKDELLPPPILEDTVYKHKHYSRGELELIAEIVAQHEREFAYLHTTHDVTIETLWQAIEGYRRN